MHLLSSVNAGFQAAPLGWVELYIRGSSTRATWYSSFEGDGPNSTGANIALDAYGSALIYVNQLVDVVVKQTDGTVVREYGDGYAAPNIEVRSDSFNGTNYDTAAVAPGNPTTLQAVLDLWETNSGGVDWKVNIEGADVTLENAFGVTTGLLFNVKSPAYGAAGDGITNDQTAIQAALAAAVAAGGGTVFFPKGTYLITTAIEWDHRVNALGQGADLSIITTNSPSNARIITWTAGTAQAAPQVVKGLSFESTQANTGSQLYATVAVNILIEECYFGANTNATGTLISFTGASSYVQVLESRFDLTGAANTSLAFAATNRFNIRGCRFVATNTAWAGTLVAVTGRGSICDSIIDISLVTGAGTRHGISNAAAGDTLHVTGCRYRSNAQTFQSVLNLVADSLVVATGNDFELTITSAASWYTVSGVLRMGSYLQSTGRQRDTGGNATIKDGIDLYEQYSNTTVPTTTMPTMLYPGQRLQLMYYNDSGAGWAAITFAGTLSVYVTAPATVPTTANATATMVEFMVADFAVAGTYRWIAINYHNNSL